MAAKTENITNVSLPLKAVSYDKVEFCPEFQVWNLRDAITTVRFDFRAVPGVSPQLLVPFKAVLTWYIENGSLTSARSYYSHLKYFFSAMAEEGRTLDRIEARHIINYKSFLGERRAWYLSPLGSAIKRWHCLGYPGIDSSATKLLNQMRKRGIVKGVAVLTLDPERGPFTDLELQSIQTALNAAFSAGKIDRQGYLLTWLFMLLGPRPGQIAAMKVCDLEIEQHGDGCTYMLCVPRLKQQGQLIRSLFKKRPLRNDIGRLLECHVKDVRTWATSVGLAPQAAPLFPTVRRPRIAVPGFEWHRTTTNVEHLFNKALAALSPVSERTGEPIHFTPYRFRYTLGTRAAEEGHGELIIAELLDHSDTQNAGIYVKATPAIIERLDKQLALQMAPLAQAFAGILVDGKEEQAQGRIVDLRFDPEHPVGGCGSHGFCGFAAPIACYTCVHFRPWLDGPHEAILDHLAAERERLMARGDTRIAAINDRTILAVAEVVRQCLEGHGSGCGVTDG